RISAGIGRADRSGHELAAGSDLRQRVRRSAADARAARLQRHRRFLVARARAHAADAARVGLAQPRAMSGQFGLHAPGFTLCIGGRAASEAFLDALSGWRVHQQVSRPSMCELTLYDAPASAIGALALGDECELMDLDGMRIFSGSVTSIRKEKRADGLRVLTVRAHDALEQLRRRQALAVRRPDTLAGLVASVVAPLGVELDADEDGPRLPLIVQWGTNDLDWLANLCAAYGKYFFLDGNSLRLMSLHGSRGPSIELDLERDLFEAAILSNAVGLRT